MATRHTRARRSFFRLEQVVRETYGYRHVIPTHQGRGAEHLLAKLLVEPGRIVPSNLYFTTSREHVELAGGIWVDVSIREAVDPESMHPFKGDVDLAALERVLAAAAPERIAFVRVEACLNMAGGQPFSVANLAAVRELTHAHGVRLILDAARISENALFVKDRERGYADWTLPELIAEIAQFADGAVFSSKKDHFVPIGGLLALNDDDLAQQAREVVVVHLRQEEFPAQALAAALYLAGGVRSMERGIVSGQHGAEPYDGLELVRLTIPRRVYTQEHLAYVADVVADVHARRELVPGLTMVHEPAHLRFFQARFDAGGPFLEPAARTAAGLAARQ